MEQVSKRGLLTPLMQGKIARLGTKAEPLVIGDWELSIEYVGGKLEVFHAVYRP